MCHLCTEKVSHQGIIALLHLMRLGMAKSLSLLTCVFLVVLLMLLCRHSTTHSKLDDKVVKCIFVGYSAESKGYRLYYP